VLKIALLRHGESVWNKENRFTGWTDVDLSDKGVVEATQAGAILKDKKFTFDIAFTSVLIRAIRTFFDRVFKRYGRKVFAILAQHGRTFFT